MTGVQTCALPIWLDTLKGVALGSDAFFPFGDNIERAHRSGVEFIAQPGTGRNERGKFQLFQPPRRHVAADARGKVNPVRFLFFSGSGREGG